MRARVVGYSLASVMVGLAAVSLSGQVDQSAVDAHVKAAQVAAGDDYKALSTTLCQDPATAPARGARAAAPGTAPAGPRGAGAPAAPGAAPAAGRAGGRGTPDRSTWYAEPVKVFDNLYFVGQSEFSVWAVKTSAGIILVDTIFDYSVEAEVIDGLTKLGLDPKTIKYAIVSHGHADHSGGAQFLQEKYGVHIIASAADYDLMDRSGGAHPKKDMVATDGMKLTLGDTTLTIYLTPGHTQGTISTLIPVKDNGQPHQAAIWGGTMFNWTGGGAAYITPSTPAAYWYEMYSKSAERFRDIVAKANVDVLISNHTAFDNSKTKLPAVLARKPGQPNPYVIGKDDVRRFLTMVDECALAGLERTKAAK